MGRCVRRISRGRLGQGDESQRQVAVLPDPGAGEAASRRSDKGQARQSHQYRIHRWPFGQSDGNLFLSGEQGSGDPPHAPHGGEADQGQHQRHGDLPRRVRVRHEHGGARSRRHGCEGDPVEAYRQTGGYGGDRDLSGLARRRLCRRQRHRCRWGHCLRKPQLTCFGRRLTRFLQRQAALHHLPVDGEVLFAHAGDVELGDEVLRRPGDARSNFGAACKGCDLVGEILRRAGLELDAVGAVDNQLRRPIDVGGDHRHARRHGL